MKEFAEFLSLHQPWAKIWKSRGASLPHCNSFHSQIFFLFCIFCLILLLECRLKKCGCVGLTAADTGKTIQGQGSGSNYACLGRFHRHFNSTFWLCLEFYLEEKGQNLGKLSSLTTKMHLLLEQFLNLGRCHAIFCGCSLQPHQRNVQKTKK